MSDALIFGIYRVALTPETATLQRGKKRNLALYVMVFHLPRTDTAEFLGGHVRKNIVFGTLDIHLHEVDFVDAELGAHTAQQLGPRDRRDCDRCLATIAVDN